MTKTVKKLYKQMSRVKLDDGPDGPHQVDDIVYLHADGDSRMGYPVEYKYRVIRVHPSRLFGLIGPRYDVILAR